MELSHNPKSILHLIREKGLANLFQLSDVLFAGKLKIL
jgi:hypothetical protein